MPKGIPFSAVTVSILGIRRVLGLFREKRPEIKPGKAQPVTHPQLSIEGHFREPEVQLCPTGLVVIGEEILFRHESVCRVGDLRPGPLTPVTNCKRGN
jgi:hypothetical protein